MLEERAYGAAALWMAWCGMLYVSAYALEGMHRGLRGDWVAPDRIHADAPVPSMLPRLLFYSASLGVFSNKHILFETNRRWLRCWYIVGGLGGVAAFTWLTDLPGMAFALTTYIDYKSPQEDVSLALLFALFVGFLASHTYYAFKELSRRLAYGYCGVLYGIPSMYLLMQMTFTGIEWHYHHYIVALYFAGLSIFDRVFSHAVNAVATGVMAQGLFLTPFSPALVENGRK